MQYLVTEQEVCHRFTGVFIRITANVCNNGERDGVSAEYNGEWQDLACYTLFRESLQVGGFVYFGVKYLRFCIEQVFGKESFVNNIAHVHLVEAAQIGVADGCFHTFEF